jgi:CRP/FNR family cyclic AMP-dependent transcriptional regulator
MEGTLLEALPDEARREVLRVARRRRFARREVVFHEGDPGDSLHLLVKGHVAVRTTTPLGDVGMLRVLGPGQVFGELALIDPAPRHATIVALDPCETLSLHRDTIDELRSGHAQVDRVLLEAVVAELRRVSTQLLEVMYVPVEKRLHRRLLHLLPLYGGQAPCTVPLTQEELAQLTGTTRPTVNRLLRDAEEAGVLRVARGRIEVLDVDALAARGS